MINAQDSVCIAPIHTVSQSLGMRLNMKMSCQYVNLHSEKHSIRVLSYLYNRCAHMLNTFVRNQSLPTHFTNCSRPISSTDSTHVIENL